MNYREMLDKFQELEQRLKTTENIVRALEHRIRTLERAPFAPTWPTPVMPDTQPMWPQEFWPTLYPNTLTCDSKENKQ